MLIIETPFAAATASPKKGNNILDEYQRKKLAEKKRKTA